MTANNHNATKGNGGHQRPRRRSLDIPLHTIEQYEQHCLYDCRLNVKTGFSFTHTDTAGVRTFVPAPCNQLKCRSCATWFWKQFMSALHEAALKLKLSFLITLTVPPTANPERNLKRALARLLQEARRVFPKPLSYAWVIGSGSNNSLHIHLLVNRDLKTATRYHKSVAWLKPTWFRLTGGQQVTVKPITPGTERNVVGYLRANLFQTVLRGTVSHRRWGCSRSIKLRQVNAKSELKWKRVNMPTALIARLEGVDANPVMNSVLQIPKEGVTKSPGKGLPVPRRCPGTPKADLDPPSAMGTAPTSLTQEPVT